jgi:hypothetical protein
MSIHSASNPRLRVVAAAAAVGFGQRDAHEFYPEWSACDAILNAAFPLKLNPQSSGEAYGQLSF